MSRETPAQQALARRREQQNGGGKLSKLIEEMGPQFQLAMPKGAEAQQLIRDALTCVRLTPKLAECDPMSVLGSLMTCAQLGLHVGVLGQAWPVPFWDKSSGGFKAQLIVGYQGYQELAWRSGQIASFMPRTVHENDEFDIDYGINGGLTHKPPVRGRRGEVIGYYSLARYVNGGSDHVYMSKEDMEDHRDRYATTRRRDGTIFGPWVDNPDAMGNKTTQRILSKSIPKGRELLIASFVDGGLRINVQPNVPADEVTTQPEVFTAEFTDDGDSYTDAADSGASTETQRKHIFALASELGQNRDERLAYCSEILGRDITSTTGLTYAEASKVITTMESFKQQQGG